MKKIFTFFFLLTMFSGKFLSAQCYAGFSYLITSYSPPTVSFTDQSSDSLGTVTGFFWDFGDGQTSTQQNPVHTYSAQGMYFVNLSITTSSGCTNSNTYGVNVVQAAQTVTAGIVSDSMGTYSCIAPDTIDFLYTGYFTGFLVTDSALVHIVFGDGTDTLFYEDINQSGFYSFMNHIYLNAGSYTAQITITAPNGMTSTSTALPVIVGATCGNISGKVYEDVNNNCVYDAGDNPVQNRVVYLYRGTVFEQSAITDANGDYSFNAMVGQTYVVECASAYGNNNHTTVTCPVGGTYTVSSLPSVGNDFGLGCLPDFDLTCHITPGTIRPGVARQICVNVSNLRCNTPTGTATVTFPPDITPLPDSVNSYTINGNEVTFPIGNSGNYYWYRCITVILDSLTPIGANECITMNVTPYTGDADTSNNSDTVCLIVGNSYDPNEKYVIPEGQGPTGLIRPDTDLEYTIVFQNTGTLEAINIFILDTLDSDLDPSSIEILGSSHTMTWMILSGNILRFSFDNINLPDSNSSEPQSHGFVSYRISQIQGIQNNAVINNTAAIYFDFNQPVITNTTVNTIDYFLSDNSLENDKQTFTIYPNPANEKCYLLFKGNASRTISIYDYTGKMLVSEKTNAENFVLNTDKLTSGIYLVEVREEKKIARSMRLGIIK